MKKIGLIFAMLFLLCSFSYAAENEVTVTVTGVTLTGKLIRVAAIGGETTGWALELDKPLNINFSPWKFIGIDIGDIKINLAAFEGDTVKVTGKLVKRNGIERESYYWVIKVETFSR